MAPLPPESTARFWLDYNTGRVDHTAMVRLGTGGTEANGLSFFSQFLAALQPVLASTFLVRGARFAPAGQLFSLPVDLGALATFTGTDTSNMDVVNEPREWVWVGRGQTTGRRWEISFYGLDIPTPDTYRVSVGAGEGVLGNARDVLVEFEGVLVTIGGDAFNVYPYVNVNNNSYWETQARSA